MAVEETSTLELRDYLRVLRRHKWIIAVSMVVCTGISLFMALSQAPVYSTGTQVLLEKGFVETLFVPSAQSDNATADRKRANQIQIMNSPEVRERVQEEIGREPLPTSFTPLLGTDVIGITAKGDDPKRVAETVNAFAKTYIAVRTEETVNDLNEAAAALQDRIDETDQKIAFIDASLIASPPAPEQIIQGRNVTPTDPRVTQRIEIQNQRAAYATELDRMRVGVSVAQSTGAKILSKAFPPTEPINRDPVRNTIAGLAIGLVLGIALAFLREYLDDSVKTKEGLEAASGLTVVGIIPAVADWKKREAAPLISVLQPRSPAAEAYRSVRTSVEFLSLDQPIGSLQVTSALASEGKTSTLSNLAVTFARAGQRVIILCCDLRRPRVHEFFGLSNRIGFTSVLLGDAPIATAIQVADRELPIGLVASGPLPPNPAELLASKRAVEAIEELDRRCDLLLIDSPPVLPVTDALVISGLVDGVLLVASAESSTKRGVKRATELLRQVDAPLIGSILNGVHAKHEYGAYGDNRYYLDGGVVDEKPAVEGRNGKSRTRPSTRTAR